MTPPRPRLNTFSINLQQLALANPTTTKIQLSREVCPNQNFPSSLQQRALVNYTKNILSSSMH